MSSPTQRYSPLPPMPTHSDEDQFDYHYILEIDLTVDPPIYNWKLTSKSKKRRVLGDLSKDRMYLYGLLSLDPSATPSSSHSG